MLIGTTLKQEG